MRRCSFCRSDVPKNEKISIRSTFEEVQCEKCAKNEAKYGKPKTCVYCRLPSAFLFNKCVHCTYWERKYGMPQTCSICKLKAAFVKDHSLDSKKLLCRLCLMTHKKCFNKSASNHKRSTENEIGALKNSSKKLKVASFLLDTGYDSSSEQVLLVQQLKDEILSLQKHLARKDNFILDREKKIASLNAEVIRLGKDFRNKLCELNKNHQDSQQTLQKRISALSRQVILLSRMEKKGAR